MSTHAIRVTGRFRLAAVGIFVALAVAVGALAVQARSVWSTTKIEAPTTEQVDRYPSKDDWFQSHNANKTSHQLLEIDRPSAHEIATKKSG
jgi:hypothetical protein